MEVIVIQDDGPGLLFLIIPSVCISLKAQEDRAHRSQFDELIVTAIVACIVTLFVD